MPEKNQRPLFVCVGGVTVHLLQRRSFSRDDQWSEYLLVGLRPELRVQMLLPITGPPEGERGIIQYPGVLCVNVVKWG